MSTRKDLPDWQFFLYDSCALLDQNLSVGLFYSAIKLPTGMISLVLLDFAIDHMID